MRRRPDSPRATWVPCCTGAVYGRQDTLRIGEEGRTSCDELGSFFAMAEQCEAQLALKLLNLKVTGLWLHVQTRCSTAVISASATIRKYRKCRSSTAPPSGFKPATQRRAPNLGRGRGSAPSIG
jgi:hypothetical protein